jgi:hypothetical protein
VPSKPALKSDMRSQMSLTGSNPDIKVSVVSARSLACKGDGYRTIFLVKIVKFTFFWGESENFFPFVMLAVVPKKVLTGGSKQFYFPFFFTRAHFLFKKNIN